jgi:hypothetical protein
VSATDGLDLNFLTAAAAASFGGVFSTGLDLDLLCVYKIICSEELSLKSKNLLLQVCVTNACFNHSFETSGSIQDPVSPGLELGLVEEKTRKEKTRSGPAG